MPDLNGFDVCEQLKSTNPQLPVIFITALAEEKNRLKVMSIGAAGFLREPFDDESLFDLLEMSIAGKSSTKKAM